MESTSPFLDSISGDSDGLVILPGARPSAN